MAIIDFLAEQYRDKLEREYQLTWANLQSLFILFSAQEREMVLTAIESQNDKELMALLWTMIRADIEGKVATAKASIEATGSITLSTLEDIIG